LSGQPIPKPNFLDECIPVKGKRRWKSKDGKRYYEWDSFHGEIEVYNSRGEHLSVTDALGNYLKPAKKGRTIDV